MTRSWRMLAALLAISLVVAACGDDDDEAVDEVPATEEPAEEEPTEAEATEAEATEDQASAPADPAQAEDEIRNNIAGFFTGLGAVNAAAPEESDAAVEDTVQFLEAPSDEDRATVESFGPLAEGLSVDIKSLEFTSDTEAEFVFDLLINGSPTQVTDSTGKAVQEDGVWKLSQETWQALAAMADTGGGEGGEGGEGG